MTESYEDGRKRILAALANHAFNSISMGESIRVYDVTLDSYWMVGRDYLNKLTWIPVPEQEFEEAIAPSKAELTEDEIDAVLDLCPSVEEGLALILEGRPADKTVYQAMGVTRLKMKDANGFA